MHSVNERAEPVCGTVEPPRASGMTPRLMAAIVQAQETAQAESVAFDALLKAREAHEAAKATHGRAVRASAEAWEALRLAVLEERAGTGVPRGE